MQATRHFTKTEAINEAKRIFGADFKHSVKIEHDGAFWVGVLLLLEYDDLQVVGNIYENPELIK